MKGQIAIDYIGGASIFFVAVLFVVLSVLSGIPEYSAGVTANRMELTGWSVTSTILNTPGYWEDAGADEEGENWEDKIGSSPDTVKSVGVAGRSGLKMDKIEALMGMDYQALKTLLGLELDFQLRISLFPVVRMSGEEYGKNGLPSDYPDITEPSYDESEGSVTGVRFGGISFNDEKHKFLAVAHEGVYDTIWASDDWDFSSADRIGPGEHKDLLDGMPDQVLNVTTTGSGLSLSEGEQFMLRYPAGVVGEPVPTIADESLEIKRFGTVNRTPVRMAMEVYDR